jgi:lysophospholipase L1-like esterase
MDMRLINKITIVAILALLQGAAYSQGQSWSKEHWVSTWATAQDLAPTVMDVPVVSPNVTRPDFSGQRGAGQRTDVPTTLENQTVRMIVHTSIGGRRLRIQLSNAVGKNPVTFGAVHIALRKTASEIVGGSDRTITFGGKPTVTVGPGVIAVSDPVDQSFEPMADLAVSLYLPKDTGPPTTHTLGLHAAYVSKGDATTTGTMPDPSITYAYLWLSSVDVVAPADAFAVVALGDSITDGFSTTRDADQAWPTLLARRLARNKGTPHISVLNEGISGNEVLRDGAGISALARFDRDVLSRAGVKWVILLEGINDINIHGQVVGPDALNADDLIFGYRQIIDRAHNYGIKVVGATIMAEEGVWLSTPVGEATRQSVNEWIRSSHSFDAVVDLDLATRDAEHLTRLKHEFNSGDNTHPNDAGNQAMADKFDLTIFTK